MNKFVEIPVSKASLTNRKLILGVGVNDSAYQTQVKVNGKSVVCPFYRAWSHMLTRCYCEKTKKGSQLTGVLLHAKSGSYSVTLRS